MGLSMSVKIDKLLGKIVGFEKLAQQALVAEAKKEKKLDPKAKVRNRGTVVVPAEKAKDKKDHFPINDEDQARNALARVNQLKKAPEWWSGSLQSLVNAVTRKVHSKYPKIEISEDAKKPGKGGGKKKKADFYTNLLMKLGQNQAYFTAQSTMSNLVNSLANGIYAQPVKEKFLQSVRSAMEKADDVRTKGKSGEFGSETVGNEMRKYLANAPNTELKNAADALETAAMQGYVYGRGAGEAGRSAINEQIAKMRTTLGQIFAAAQQMWEAAEAEVQAIDRSPPGQYQKEMNAPAERQIPTVNVHDLPNARPRGRGGDSKIRAVQVKLNQIGLTGADGKRLAEDGILGKNTRFAIDSYKSDFNMPKATDAMAIYNILNTSPEEHAGRIAANTEPTPAPTT